MTKNEFDLLMLELSKNEVDWIDGVLKDQFTPDIHEALTVSLLKTVCPSCTAMRLILHAYHIGKTCFTGVVQ